MKHLLVVGLIVCFSSSVFAQESLNPQATKTVSAGKRDTGVIVCMCCGVPKQSQPLFIVKVHQKNFVLDTLSNVNPSGIEKVEVLKDAAATKEYGEAGKSGVIIITLKDEKYSENLDEFKGHIKKVGL